MKGVETTYDEAEVTRKRLLERDVLLAEYKPIKKDSSIVFPVEEGGSGGYSFEKYEEKKTFEERVNAFLTPKEKKEFIHSYDTIGDIAIIQIPTLLEPKQERIGQALLDSKLSLSSVRKRGEDHGGKYRTQKTVLVAGQDKTVTTHVEHGTRIRVDVDEVYFSPRLSTERGRIVKEVCGEENVLVLFDGCGPFSLVLANNTACDVTGVEWNKRGVELARKGSELNKIEHKTRYIHGDVRNVLPSLEDFDRILMPAPHNADTYISDLHSRLVDGSALLHVYLFVEEERMRDEGDRVVAKARTVFRKATLEGFVTCGQKSPGVYRVCYDILIQT